MLCMFVLPPTSLIKVANSGSFHWASKAQPGGVLKVLKHPP